MISPIKGVVLLSCVSQSGDGAPIPPLRLSESDSAVSTQQTSSTVGWLDADGSAGALLSHNRGLSGHI